MPKPKRQDLNGDWQLLGDNLVTWDEPITLEGTYEGSETVKGRYGEQKRHGLTVDTPDGPYTYQFFAPAMLERGLADQRLHQGDWMQIEFTGQSVESQNGRQVKEFFVRLRRRARQ